MKAAGIICEYNPFHNGHIYHIQKTREATDCDVLVCVMSGNFVQRGEPAIIDKWTRTKAALAHGVDLVLELPFPFATQSAKQFAQGSVDTLALAKVSDIVFGSESNDLKTLKKLAQLDTSAFRNLMDQGLSSAKAYELIYGTMNPNDILAINYMQAMTPYGIQPHTIQRTNHYHSVQMESTFASATALRTALIQGQNIADYTPLDFQALRLHTLDEYYPFLQSLLLTLPIAYLNTLFLMDEGIESQLQAKARQFDDLPTFLSAVTSKRYSTSRIRRTLIHLMHQTSKETINALPSLSHIRVLGFNAIGQAYLKELKQTEQVQIASRINQVPLVYRNMELKTAQLYGMYHKRKETLDQELQPPIRL